MHSPTNRPRCCNVYLVVFSGGMEAFVECVYSIKINSVSHGRTKSRRSVDGRNSKSFKTIIQVFSAGRLGFIYSCSCRKLTCSLNSSSTKGRILIKLLNSGPKSMQFQMWEKQQLNGGYVWIFGPELVVVYCWHSVMYKILKSETVLINSNLSFKNPS